MLFYSNLIIGYQKNNQRDLVFVWWLLSKIMNTKLVYVLTSASDKHYIEQALMAVYSARHWNPDAHIVLVVDDIITTGATMASCCAELSNAPDVRLFVASVACTC